MKHKICHWASHSHVQFSDIKCIHCVAWPSLPSSPECSQTGTVPMNTPSQPPAPSRPPVTTTLPTSCLCGLASPGWPLQVNPQCLSFRCPAHCTWHDVFKFHPCCRTLNFSPFLMLNISFCVYILFIHHLSVVNNNLVKLKSYGFIFFKLELFLMTA